MQTQRSSTDCPRVDGMPMLGLGTWKNSDSETCAESVATALEMGYRHIDTAQAYGNEAAVGAGIERSDVDREEVPRGRPRRSAVRPLAGTHLRAA